MLKKVVILTAAFLVLGGMSSAFADSWVGTVSDSMCGAKHARAGAEAATCVAKCVAGGSKYVLVSKGKVYQLDPQDKFADFAGKSVKVTGTMSGESITAESVEAHAHTGKKAEKPSGQ